jgi:circadian clock protein KaiB
VDVSSRYQANYSSSHSVASGFKGIALFTPGGDCVYCIDQQKQVHWHIDLCTALQQHLGLAEPPYFLLPCFTATIDQWFDTDTQQLVTVAEAYPRVMAFQPLLNVLFDQPNRQWQPNYTYHAECSPSLIEVQRQRFPRLWQSHDLILKIDRLPQTVSQATTPPQQSPSKQVATSPYLFKLFVRTEDTPATETMLRLLRQSLETYLKQAYTLQVVDVSKHPDEAESYHISATPTLVQVLPESTRRIVGNLSNPQQFLDLLGHQS